VTRGTEHVYDDAHYAAGSWPRERRVLIKAEVVWGQGKEPKDNPRFVITNMKQSPQWLYEKVYCQRGDIENRIKDCMSYTSAAPVAAASGPTSSVCCSPPRLPC